MKAFASPQVKSRVTVDGVVSVIDAAAYASGNFVDAPLPGLHENPLEEVFADQLACADLVVLNKTDRVADDAARISREIASAIASRRAPAAHAVPSHRLPKILLGLGAGRRGRSRRAPSHHDTEDGHDHDDFESFSVAIGPGSELSALTRRLGETIVQHNILCVKGFLTAWQADAPGAARCRPAS